MSGTIIAEYSPYEISGDILVEEGNTLVIEPGVTFLFSDNTDFTVNGTLIAQGNPDNLITFEPLGDAYWEGIYFNSEHNNILQYCVIKGSDIRDLYFFDSVSSVDDVSENWNLTAVNDDGFVSGSYYNSPPYSIGVGDTDNDTREEWIVYNDPFQVYVDDLMEARISFC